MPYTILQIDSSPLNERSVSRKLTSKVLAELGRVSIPQPGHRTRFSNEPFPAPEQSYTSPLSSLRRNSGTRPAAGFIPMARPKVLDYQETYLRAILGFIGLTNISFVRAEGVAAGPDGANTAMQSGEVRWPPQFRWRPDGTLMLIQFSHVVAARARAGRRTFPKALDLQQLGERASLIAVLDHFRVRRPSRHTLTRDFPP